MIASYISQLNYHIRALRKHSSTMYVKVFVTLLFLIGASSQFQTKFLHNKLTSLSASKFAVAPPSISLRCLTDWANKLDQLTQCENFYLNEFIDKLGNASSIQEIERLFCAHIVNVQGCFNMLSVSNYLF